MEENKVKQLNHIMKDMFNAITEDDFLKVSGGELIYNQQVVPKAAINELVSEANMIMNSGIWKMLLNEMKYESQKLMFEKAQTIDDLVFGKACLYMLDVIERKLFSISKLNK